MSELPIIAFVVPCYNENEVLESTFNIILDKINQLIYNNLVSKSSFVLFVDDGSTDDTWFMIYNQSKKTFNESLNLI